jgi:hypothetical protein
MAERRLVSNDGVVEYTPKSPYEFLKMMATGKWKIKPEEGNEDGRKNTTKIRSTTGGHGEGGTNTPPSPSLSRKDGPGHILLP